MRLGRVIGLWSCAALLALTCLLVGSLGRHHALAEEGDPPLNVGVLTGPAPYYDFSDVTGEPIGFAIAMWADVARRAGLQYQIVYFEKLGDLQKAAAEKTIDVAPLLTIDPKSSEVFDFSETVHQSPVSIFTRKTGSVIGGLSDLAGHRVSVIDGHIGQSLMRTYRGELSIAHETLGEALSALMTRTSDAIVYQEYILWQLARQQGIDSLLRTVGPPLRKLDMAIAVRKGRREVLAALKPALKAYLRSPDFYAARAPWGGNPPPWVSPILIAQVLGALLGIAVIGLGLWRHYSIMRLNKALARSVAEQKSAEERFKDVAEAASDWFFEQDEDLRFTFVSSRFEEVAGIPRERLIGQTRWDVAAAYGTAIGGDALREHIATLKAHRDWRDFSYTLITASGEKRMVTTSGKAIFDAAGKFVGYRGVGRDITRRIALENALQQAQKMELVGQLTGGIAHDFNNLLTVMVGNLEMLKRRMKDDAQSGVYLDTASEAVEIGSQLVQRLLGFSRRQSLHPRSTDINKLVHGMLPLVRSSLGSPVAIKLALGDSLPPVFADDVQLQNALLNLAINARDAMPAGGELGIETEQVVVDQGFVDRHPGACVGRYLALRVRDTGTGIAQEDLAKVIEPFFTTKEVGKGSGLGLSMVYGFAQQSDGFILIDSAVGAGTTVSIYLPAADAEAVATADPHSDGTGAELNCKTGKTVLVVEDDDRVREVTIARLQHLGYHVLDAGNAAAALATLQSQSAVDLMLTDIVMPGGMSGIDLAAEVSRARPEIKILFSAGYSKEADILHGQGKLGPWLRKPYKQADLAKKIREVLAA